MNQIVADSDVNEISRHSRIISDLAAKFPEVKTAGMWKALRQNDDCEYTSALLIDDADWRRGVKFVPDAWTMCHESRTLFIFEVVVTHDITPAKFARMVDLAWALDEDHWSVALTYITDLGSFAYDVKAASLVGDLELAEKGLPSTGFRVPNWKRLTAAYCNTVSVPEVVL